MFTSKPVADAGVGLTEESPLVDVSSSQPPVSEHSESPLIEDMAPIVPPPTVPAWIPVPGEKSMDDFGILTNAQITVQDGNVIVSVASARGSVTQQIIPVPLAAAWLLERLASPVTDEARRQTA